MSAVKILPAEENHLDEVNQFLIKHFFSREPLGLRLGISPAKDTQEWISQVTLPLLNQNMSCLAFHQNEIVGLCLNKIAFKDASKNIVSFEDVVKDQNIFMNKILEFMDVLYENVDVFQEEDNDSITVDKVLLLHMICVSEDFKGHGISSKMMKWSETQAKSQDITLLSAETTGIASAKIFQNAGFQKVKELSYDDYQDPNGEKIFANLDPHKSCIIWKKQI